jgi:predicted helicase
MVKKDFELENLYNKGFELDNLFLIKSLGIQTHRDNFAIAFTQEKVKNRIRDFYNPDLSNEELINKYQLRETKEWQLDKYRNGNFNESNIRKIDYRFFDTRYTYYSRNVVDRDRRNVMQHLLNDNIAITLSKQLSILGYQHIFLSKNIQESCLISLKTKEGGYSFPLYYYSETNGQQTIGDITQRKPNLNAEIVNLIAEKLALTFTNEKEETKGTFAPIDVLDYIYAVLHSPSYREKYKEFLKIDFPRVPYPENQDTFWELVRLGGEIRQIHLLESPTVEQYITQYPIAGDNLVSRKMSKNSPGYVPNNETHGKVYVNDEQYFDNVPLLAWEFYIGGYQPAQKWLKDRKGRKLEWEDIAHYQKIIVALTETNRIMKEINETYNLNN